MNISDKNLILNHNIALVLNKDKYYVNLYYNNKLKIWEIINKDIYFKYSLLYKIYLKLYKINSYEEFKLKLLEISKKLNKRDKLIKYIKNKKFNISRTKFNKKLFLTTESRSTQTNIVNKTNRNYKNQDKISNIKVNLLKNFKDKKLENNKIEDIQKLINENTLKKISDIEIKKPENDKIIKINNDTFINIKKFLKNNFKVKYIKDKNVIFIKNLKDNKLYTLQHNNLIDFYKIKINKDKKLLLKYYKKIDKLGILLWFSNKNKCLKFYISKINNITNVIKNINYIYEFIEKFNNNSKKSLINYNKNKRKSKFFPAK